MPMKPGACPARALPMGAQRHLCGPMRNSGLVALSVFPNGDEKRRLSRAGRPDLGFQLHRSGCG